jgi:hypothetical protein
MNKRVVLLIVALIVTVLLAFWPQPEEQSRVVEPKHRVQSSAAKLSHPTTPSTAQKQVEPPVRFAELDGDLFPSQTWRPPPPKPRPVKPLPPPPPAPPDFFFSYFGRWLEGGKEVIFLKQDDQVMRTHIGDVVAGQWRLDQVEAGDLVFTYLPLNMQKTLRTQ